MKTLRHLIILVGLFTATATSNALKAQSVSINNTGALPDTSAILDVSSTEKGFLMPRMTTAQMNAIVDPADGLMIYNTDSSGFYFFDGVSWAGSEPLTSSVLDTLDENVFSARIGNNGTATIQSQTQNFIASVNRISVGQVQINFVSGFFTQAPAIIASVKTQVDHIASVGTVSTSNCTINVYDVYSTGAGAFTDDDFYILANRQGSDYRFNTASGSAASLSPQTLSDVLSEGNDAAGESILNLGALGIGTSSPSEKLDLVGTATIDTLNINSAYTFPILDGNPNQIQYTDGSGVLAWSSVRNLYGESSLPDTVGIHLMDTILVTQEHWISGDGDQEGLFVNNAGKVHLSKGIYHNQYDNLNYIEFLGNNATSIYAGDFVTLGSSEHIRFNVDKNTTRLAVTDSGIGMGTTSPNYDLEIVSAGTANDAQIVARNSDGTHVISWSSGHASADPFVSWQDGDDLVLATNAAGFSEKLRLTTDGKIGMGTTNPLQMIDMRGPDTDNGALITMSNSDRSHFLQLFPGRLNDPNPFIQVKEGDPLRFATDAGGFTEFMRIDTNGNVGIGTDEPTYKLDISGSLRTWSAWVEGTGTGFTGTTILDTAGNSRVSFSMSGKTFYNNALTLGTYLNGVWTNPIIIKRGAPTNSMFIDSLGLVGIGSTSPDAKLTIGTPGATWTDYGITSDSRIGVTNGSGNRQTAIMMVNSGIAKFIGFNYQTNAPMNTQVGDPGSYVGIATTGAAGRTLDVNGDLRVNGRIYNDLNDRYLEIDQQNTKSNNGSFTYSIANGVQLLPEASNNGTVGGWSKEWNSIVGINMWRTFESTVSDRRAKMNIENYENALSTLMKLRGVRYDINPKTHPAYCNSDTNAKPVHQLGFIAQEVKEVIPEMVSYADAYGLYTIVNYEQMFPVVVGAIQEQQKLIDSISATGNGLKLGRYAYSDYRFKTEVTPLGNTLASLNQINGIYHKWDRENFPNKGFPENRSIGLIAQDLQKIYPELVSNDKDGYLTVDYSKFTVVLLEAIKEQQQLIEELKAQQQSDTEKIEELYQMVNAILLQNGIEPNLNDHNKSTTAEK